MTVTTSFRQSEYQFPQTVEHGGETLYFSKVLDLNEATYLSREMRDRPMDWVTVGSASNLVGAAIEEGSGTPFAREILRRFIAALPESEVIRGHWLWSPTWETEEARWIDTGLAYISPETVQRAITIAKSVDWLIATAVKEI